MNINKKFTFSVDIVDIALVGTAVWAVFTFGFFIMLGHLLSPDGSVHFLMESGVKTPFDAAIHLIASLVAISVVLFVRHKLSLELGTHLLYPEYRTTKICLLAIHLFVFFMVLPTFLGILTCLGVI